MTDHRANNKDKKRVYSVLGEEKREKREEKRGKRERKESERERDKEEVEVVIECRRKEQTFIFLSFLVLAQMSSLSLSLCGKRENEDQSLQFFSRGPLEAQAPLVSLF